MFRFSSMAHKRKVLYQFLLCQEIDTHQLYYYYYKWFVWYITWEHNLPAASQFTLISADECRLHGNTAGQFRCRYRLLRSFQPQFISWFKHDCISLAFDLFPIIRSSFASFLWLSVWLFGQCHVRTSEHRIGWLCEEVVSETIISERINTDIFEKACRTIGADQKGRKFTKFFHCVLYVSVYVTVVCSVYAF